MNQENLMKDVQITYVNKIKESPEAWIKFKHFLVVTFLGH